MSEIEEVGEGMMDEYMKGRGLCCDIEGFITERLGMRIEYADIADRNIMAFISDGRCRVETVRGGRKKKRIFRKGTLVVNGYLLRNDMSGQRRFTLAHEAAHVLIGRMSACDAEPVSDRTDDAADKGYSTERSEFTAIVERTADRMATALLMPKGKMRELIRRYGTPVIYGKSTFKRSDKIRIQEMADTLGVTFTAMKLRLEGLDMMEHRDIREYIREEMDFSKDAGKRQYI